MTCLCCYSDETCLGMWSACQRCWGRSWSRRIFWCWKLPPWLRGGRKAYRSTPGWSLMSTCWQDAPGISRNWYQIRLLFICVQGSARYFPGSGGVWFGSRKNENQNRKWKLSHKMWLFNKIKTLITHLLSLSGTLVCCCLLWLSCLFLQIEADISKRYHSRPVNLMGVNI